MELVGVEGFIYAGLALLIGSIMLYAYRFFKQPEVQSFLDDYYSIIDLVGAVVTSIAKNQGIITPEEWEIYNLEAVERKLDVRLVAVLYEVGDVLDTFGIDLPERVLLHIIETEYAKLKSRGDLNPSGTDG